MPRMFSRAVLGCAIVVSAVQGFAGTDPAGPRAVGHQGNAALIRATATAGVDHFVLVRRSRRRAAPPDGVAPLQAPSRAVTQGRRTQRDDRATDGVHGNLDGHPAGTDHPDHRLGRPRRGPRPTRSRLVHRHPRRGLPAAAWTPACKIVNCVDRGSACGVLPRSGAGGAEGRSSREVGDAARLTARASANGANASGGSASIRGWTARQW